VTCFDVDVLLLDATRAPFATRAGISGLLLLWNELKLDGKRLRIAARPGQDVWRILMLLPVALEVYRSVGAAWKGSSPRPGRPPRRRRPAPPR
jgi:hypothetical protein